MHPFIAAGILLAAASPEDPFARCIAARAEALGFSGVVSIVRPQGVTSSSHGVVSGAGSAAIEPSTRFNLASAGKMFTAVAVAQLVEAGKIGFDDRIGKYVDGITPEAAAVTVRQLLAHRSGLGNFFTPDNLPALEKARTVADLMPLVAADKPAFEPGSRLQYSNSGFLLLGRVIERVSGLSYGEYLAAHVFGPAGMAKSGLSPEAAHAVGMTSQGTLRPAREAAIHGSPAGGSYSTASDLQRFFAALLEGKLVSATMQEQLTTPQSPAGPGAPAYGLGFGAGTIDGHRWFGHNGGAPGVNVEAAAFPDDHAALIVLSNRDPPTATTLFRDLRRTLFDPSALHSCGQ